jgi:quinol monooxygenase YgiN
MSFALPLCQAQLPGDDEEKFMMIVHVHVHVKSESVEAFRVATVENARNSRQEPGIERFDVLQQADDPARFLLIEIYREPEAQLRHRETAHYAVWRDAVAGMMAEPRSSVKYVAF